MKGYTIPVYTYPDDETMNTYRMMGNAEINFDDMDIQDVRFYQIENTCEHPYHPGLSIIQSGGHQFTSPLAPSKIQNILEL